MRVPVTLSFYIGRQFLLSIGIVFSVVIALIIMIDSIEIIRRSYNKNVPLTAVIELVLLKLPDMIQQILPFAILLGSILTFTRLTRTYELIVVRAAGVSVWQFLMPTIIIALTLGAFLITTFNPLSAAVLSRYESVEAKYLSNSPQSMLAVSSSGLWLREKDAATDERRVLHALKLRQHDMVLHDVTLFMFKDGDTFTRRIDAEQAQLVNGQWKLEDVILTAPSKIAERFDEYYIDTTIIIEQLQDSFASPETISFWELPSFIETLQDTGFSALKHQLHWHTILVSPFLFCAMVFIAAVFSFRLPRRGRVGFLIVGGIMTGFLFYYLSGLVSALGESGNIPIILAAWGPVTITSIISIAILLHMEDG